MCHGRDLFPNRFQQMQIRQITQGQTCFASGQPHSRGICGADGGRFRAAPSACFVIRWINEAPMLSL